MMWPPGLTSPLMESNARCVSTVWCSTPFAMTISMLPRLDSGTKQIHLQIRDAWYVVLGSKLLAKSQRCKRHVRGVNMGHCRCSQIIGKLTGPAAHLEHLGVYRNLLTQQFCEHSFDRTLDEAIDRIELIIIGKWCFFVERLHRARNSICYATLGITRALLLRNRRRIPSFDRISLGAIRGNKGIFCEQQIFCAEWGNQIGITGTYTSIRSR